MPAPTLDFPVYAIMYSTNAREQRNTLPAPLRETLMEIEDGLVQNPDKHPLRTIRLDVNMFIYRHPKPALEVTYKIDRERDVISILHLVPLKLEVSKSVVDVVHFIGYFGGRFRYADRPGFRFRVLGRTGERGIGG